MEKSIRIVYDVKQTVRFSFWKYFFEMTGMWANVEQYDGVRRIDKYEYEKTLFIVSKRSEWLIADERRRNWFYIVREKSEFAERQRPDICTMNLDSKEKCETVISWMFRADPEIEELLEMYDYYRRNNMWKYLWLFQEFSYAEGDIDVYYKLEMNMDAEDED